MAAAQAKAEQSEPAAGRGHPILRAVSVLLVIGLAGGAGAWVWVIVSDPGTLPIRSVQVEGSFRHLHTRQLEKVIARHISGGFFNIDIGAIHKVLANEPWIDHVEVRRVWPDTLRIRVAEQVPLARWDDHGLVNVHGDWFGAAQDKSTAGLPELAGPDGFQPRLAQAYHRFTRELQPLGLQVRQLDVNERRAWRLVLSGGIEVRLGRRSVERRLRRFIRVYPIVNGQRPGQIAAVDLRYTNGFAVSWKAGQPQPQPNARGS
ncbi:MAG: cell division protein FtsQ/DivIB [Gammaproteobacteria bacterium]